MNLTEDKKREYSKRILLSRFRILNSNGFFGLLLLHVKFGLDENCDTAYTDGERINFSPDFLSSLSNQELDFVMMHEIMHIVLRHCFRGKLADPHLFNIACDIVVNSNILHANNMNLSSITLKDYGVSMHKAPNDCEGYLYTAEEVYEMLVKKGKKDGKKEEGNSSNNNSKDSSKNSSNQKNSNNKNDNDKSNDSKSKNESSDSSSSIKSKDDKKTGKKGNKSGNLDSDSFDDHSHWEGETEKSKEKADEWQKNVMDAAETISITEKGNKRGNIPLGALRVIEELKNPTVDWKLLLNDFVSFEINDYSFLPPDKRYEGPFYMPDFNEETPNKKLKLLFFIDTSASISDEDLTKAYSEIKGAIDEGDTFEGYLCFFDHKVYDVNEFCDIDELVKIRPVGGGGTSFFAIFEKLNDIIEEIQDDIQAIIILTDGYALYPEEEKRQNIPVLWIINNDHETPPWGVVARMK